MSGRKGGLQPDLEGSRCQAEEGVQKMYLKKRPQYISRRPSRNVDRREQGPLLLLSLTIYLSGPRKEKGELKEDKETPWGDLTELGPLITGILCSYTHWGIMKVAHLSRT